MGDRLQFSILGPLEVRRDGRPVPIGGPRQRALLAVLLCNANRVVSRDRLIDELLGDQPAGSAERMLRVQVSRLRKALTADGDAPRLLTQPPGYSLRIAEHELDLHTFEQRLTEGREALQRADPDHGAATLREAESLWRGRPLADLEFEPFARLEVQRLEELRLLAVEERIEAELTLGRHAALCPELETLSEEHPLRERLRGQLMLALYRSGRQADALDAYRAGRALLVDELALEPGPQLRQLEQAILEQDTALDLDPASPGGAVAAPPRAVGELPAIPPPPGPPPSNGHRRHGKWAATALVAAILLAGVAIVPQLGNSAMGVPSRHENLVALVSPASDRVAATVRLSSAPDDISTGFGSLWVSEPQAGLVVRVDANRRTTVASIPVGARPERVIVAAGGVWVLDRTDRTVSRIDPVTDTVAQTIAAGADPSDLSFSDGSLWVANRSAGTVTRLDPHSGAVRGVVRTGGDPSGLAGAPGAMWVADDESGTVDRIDARTGVITNAIRVGDSPTALVATPAAVWVLDPLDATLSRVDPRLDAVTATVALGGAPAGLTLSDGRVWVADAQHGTLLRVDPGRAQVTRTLLVGGQTGALADGGGLWAAIDQAGPNHRGGTLTAATAYQVIDTMDPASSTSNNVSPPQFLGLTNDGLVSVDHVPGPAGVRLVPDLALSLPRPTDGGLRYVFRLRPGLRYSTGAVVRASDVTHSLQRVFATGSSGADWYGSIVGAAACLRHPADCSLARGVVADDRAQTVTFQLTRPDPDFLYKLSLSYADVLPGSTPYREARGPLPATGPYEVSRYLPGQRVLLVRNPRFREWSAAAQPEGYPDRVLLRLDLSGAAGARSVVTGQSDFMANLGQIPARYAGYFLRRHRTQVMVNPLMETSFMFLNLHAPPFDDIRVRRALNLALDRARIAGAWGGPLGAQPTCQILPPGIPGYARYCPYTRFPAPSGRWRTANLSRARQLVEASGTRGIKVTVWNTSGGPVGSIGETEDTVSALRQLGYRAALRVLPSSTYFAYTGDSRNRAQVIDGGWNADYASANDFLGKLTCSYYRPANGPATTDESELCDSAVDRQIARADALQAADPDAAAADWARIDGELTNRAIFLPTVTSNEVDLVSRRTGDYQYNPVWGALLDQLWVR